MKMKWSDAAPAYYPTPNKLGIAADRISGALPGPEDAKQVKLEKAPPVVGEIEMKPFGKGADLEKLATLGQPGQGTVVISRDGSFMGKLSNSIYKMANYLIYYHLIDEFRALSRAR